MKIVDKRKQNIVAFTNVPVGRAFIFLHTDEMGNSPYLRTTNVTDEDGEVLNAVDLEDGYLVNVGESVPVILCNAEVIIN